MNLISTNCVQNDVLEDTDDLVRTPDGFQGTMFQWNPQSTRVQPKKNEFKTVLGSQTFYEGNRYYFEIFLNRGAQLKIGVCRRARYEGAFCDTANGWAIYNGQTRHNSRISGKKYGSSFKMGDIIGMAVDMIDGTIEYSNNGQSWGCAFEDPQLKKGQLVAAVASLYSSDVFSIRTALKED